MRSLVIPLALAAVCAAATGVAGEPDTLDSAASARPQHIALAQPVGRADAGSARDGAPQTAAAALDLLAHARNDLAAMSLRSDHVQDWLGEARRRGDGKRVACLNEALSQEHATERDMQFTLGVAELALQALGPESVEPFRERLRTLATRSAALQVEANACGKEVAVRPHGPTGYEVRAKNPPLPGDPGDHRWRMVRRESQFTPAPRRLGPPPEYPTAGHSAPAPPNPTP